MRVYIHKNKQQLGPFDESRVVEMLQSGQLSPDDAAIRHGENQWQKLGSYFSDPARLAPAQAVDPMAKSDFPCAAEPMSSPLSTWVNQNLQEPLEIRTKTSKYVAGILLLLFFVPLAAGVIFTLARESVEAALLAFVGVVVIGLAALAFFLHRRTKPIIRTISQSGVFTRSGQRFDWNDYIGATYFLVRRSTLGPILIWNLELEFKNGKASLSPVRVRNADRIVEFISRLPGEHIKTAA